MAIPYAVPNDCLDVVSGLNVPQARGGELETALFQSLLDASRLFEADVMVPEDFFAPADDVATVRTIYTDGTSIIPLPPFVELVSVSDGTLEPVEIADPEDYRVNIPYHPELGHSVRWNFGLCGRFYAPTKILVEARWGFKCIPGDVKVAVKNMGCLMYLLNSNTRLGQNTEIEDLQEVRLRNTYNRILQSWKDKVHHRQLGIG